MEQVSTTKSLGVYIDQNLNWEFHIKEILKKLASGTSAIKRIRNFVPHEILPTIYNYSLIQPHFDYCSVVWGCYSKGLSQKLQIKLPYRTVLHVTIITSSNYCSCNTDELLHNLTNLIINGPLVFSDYDVQHCEQPDSELFEFLVFSANFS